MSTLPEARIRDDDWTETADPVERRRRQNRLHQRAWRRRKRLQQKPGLDDSKETALVPSLVDRDMLQKVALDHVSGRQRIPVTLKQLQNWSAFGAIVETLGDSAGTFAIWAELRAWRKWELITDLSASASSSSSASSDLCENLDLYSASSVTSPTQSTTLSIPAKFDSLLVLNDKYALHGSDYEVDFPISFDHKLLVVIQHNCLRGMLSNMAILIRLKGQDFQGWADFYLEDIPSPPEDSPRCLQFTQLQKAVSHESWIDIVPSPNMRDNIIKCQDRFDTDELCYDFLGGYFEGKNEIMSRGMILWGDPWNSDAWELSENFIKKWWFLLQGCGDIIASTNKWRATRGEKKLAINNV